MKEIEVPDIDYKEEVKKCKTMEDVVGRNGLLQRLLKDVIQNMLEAEMEELLGREKYQRSEDSENKNYRNGYSKKSIRSSVGDVNLDIPRDRKADFEPKVVKKYETVCNELDKKIIGLYARGMSTRDIQSELEELYGIDVSPTMISKITDKVMDSAAQWQNRALDDVYPIVYMDAIHFKVREENKIVTKAAYICMALDMKGYKDILGIWIGEAEGAKFWLSVCNDLRNRGVKEILIACMDGLKGLPDAIKSVFPDVSIQNCIIHQIRNSIKYIASKDKKEFMKDLKCVYKAPTEDSAINGLDNLKKKWDQKYSIVIESWYNNWDKLSTYFNYSPEIRKIIYTTNALEGFNRQLRKFTKIRTVFPNDEALRKSLYLATEKVMEKWTSPSQNWGMTLAQLTIVFNDKLGEEIL
ncbi:IS256 family transposase [Clostridium sp. AWRP]|uniref:IS256 family transposase n=1 Tax=Clostridium sp. AWRP TaxID=2212991 RepID=UPI000FDAD11F|nr:IS256 family transposase [Clostridium sp. AWRP]AZV56781.1 IS256 family transposase [Clostridium sp. AWRP]AZV56813.1 IS256 family transposase [Clostridium sp. AWRP]AZV57288.1 IS256 family transposase [Clostridium sp. AWRP]AZV57705.1 IS256 family transposase [Clostridium sp. AWRP]AZV58371.1 IS256 family transposase [Clostridium sp. AWRP]